MRANLEWVGGLSPFATSLADLAAALTPPPRNALSGLGAGLPQQGGFLDAIRPRSLYEELCELGALGWTLPRR